MFFFASEDFLYEKDFRGMCRSLSIVQSKIKIISEVTLPCVIPNVYDYPSTAEHRNEETF